MTMLRRLLTIIWVSTLIVAGVVLYLYNPTEVQLDLVWWQTPPMGLAALVAGVFFLGLMTGLMVVLIMRVMGLRR